MTRYAARRSLLFVAALACPAGAWAGGRHVAIILDTSGSMISADRARYTVQLSQVISDLVDDGDELNVIRMEDESSCSAGASSSLVFNLDPGDRQSLKTRLDREIGYDTGTYFAAPIRTASALLSASPDAQRMLLIIADSGGLGSCEQELTRELLALRQSGVTIAAINLGGTAGAFDSNPAFAFTTAALDAQGLIEAVAQVYQKFLGAKTVQTGRVQGAIQVEVAPFVEEAFLVVAADGPLAAVEPAAGNPGAAGVDPDHRGGGSTQGLDGQTRAYRIVRLERPSPGRWTFNVPGLSATAGWMLLQDSSVGLRLVSSPDVARGIATPMEIEVFDRKTGKRITDPSQLPGLGVTLEVDGRKVTFQDDGQNGDRAAGDGILTGMMTLDQDGQRKLPVRLESDLLDRTVEIETRILDAAWRLAVKTPPKAQVDHPLLLEAELQPFGDLSQLKAPERIDALTGGPAEGLRDDGTAGDRKAGDRIYSRLWTPAEVGTVKVEYLPVGGSATLRAAAPLEVLGRLELGALRPIRLGQACSGAEVGDRLELGEATIRGGFDATVSSSFDLDRTVLEIDLGEGWVPLGDKPLPLRLTESGPRAWPVRLRVGSCPEGNPPGRRFEVVLEATGPDGKPRQGKVPLEVAVVKDPWLRCWWPVLATGAGLVIVGILVHGFWSPSRFSPGLGVTLSPEEDMTEGFFHPIRGQRGTGSGFYRDARVFIRSDFRLSARSRDALARLRADSKLVRIEPVHGAALWRQNAEGTWEQLPSGETTARFGDLYRNDGGTLFFEIRNT